MAVSRFPSPSSLQEPGNGNASPLTPPAYVDKVLAMYRALPGTSGRLGRADRLLAYDLQRRSVPLETIYAALLLATLRRAARPPEKPPLPSVRSLTYYLPVVEEILRQPLPAGYLGYLERRFARVSAPPAPPRAISL